VNSTPHSSAPVDVVVTYDFLPQIGGAHTWLYEVYRRWDTAVQLYTAAYPQDPAVAARARKFDSEAHGALRIVRSAHVSETLSLLDPRCLRQFAHNVADLRRLRGPGHVRLHSLRAFPEGFTSYLYAKTSLRRSTLITYAHGEEIMIAKTSRQLGFMAQRVYSASDLVIVNSENTRGLVLDISPDAKIVCIHPGVASKSFAIGREEASSYRQSWCWPPEAVVLCTVARMEARKNHAAVIRAVSALRREGCPVAYVCGGDGPERPALEALARSLGVESWVRFPGPMPERDKQLIFCASDIHIMPSIQVGAMIEGFGIVFLEAAAAGKPSICGRSGGQAEAVKDGVTGIVVDGASEAEVCASIRRLAADSDLRRAMGEAGLSWAAQHDWGHGARLVREQVASLAGNEAAGRTDRPAA